jgi:transposase
MEDGFWASGNTSRESVLGVHQTGAIPDNGKGLSEAATELGLSPGQLSLWRNEHLAAGSAEALALRKAEQAEMQRLKRENKRLEEEVEILKKAAAFFARGIA